jgi:hypothetical protein
VEQRFLPASTTPKRHADQDVSFWLIADFRVIMPNVRIDRHSGPDALRREPVDLVARTRKLRNADPV